ncbi:MAG TPA: GlsB/YeaQ/YmgE family stress response membrane protein [Pseudolabrys sp.]|nr:GlsB/YeaQ/YmgE family stress response membrane protein [Pseudolabrys sp.]
MHISDQGILVILLVGLVAGWLAGKIVEGGGFGLIGDIAIGIVGALIGSWLMPRLGIHLASGVLSAIIIATIGAVLLLVIVRFAGGAYPRRRSWRW